MIKPILKFRPSLTSDMIKEIYCSLQNGETKDYIRNYILKIDNNLIQPNYVNTGIKPKADISSNLGFSQEELESKTESKTDFVSKRLETYNKWLQDPVQITTDELELVQTYRYESSLMTKEEEVEYENKLFNLGI